MSVTTAPTLQVSCEGCDAPLVAASPARTRGRDGRAPRYCSNACRQRAYRRRAAASATTAADPAREAAGNVLAQLDSFVGRTEEVAALTRLLRRQRLITLIGPAGSGKTRLAMELAGRVQCGYRDGAWSIDLAAIANGDLVVQTISRTLDIGEQRGKPMLDALCGALADRELLLVLDNCEHLLEQCATTIETLLRRCPALRVLATSREALRVCGEWTFPVAELSLPVTGGVPGKDAAARSDAVRLFVDRASAVDAGFRLTDENAATVAALCQRLDGMPLPIELAARRIRLLGAADILARLDDRLGLLTLADRTATSRHRSLQAAIDWSYTLLEPDEQVVLRRLSALSGPFTIELASAVCGGGDGPSDLSPEVVLDLMASLEAKSLLVRVRTRDDATLLRQLESIRVYGRERLIESGELEATYERLVDWLVGALEPHLGDFTVAARVRELDAEWNNVQTAVEWTAARVDERYAPLAYAQAACWQHRGYTVEAGRLLTGALERARRPEYTSLLLTDLCSLAVVRGRCTEGLRLAEQALEIEQKLDRPGRLAKILHELGTAWGHLGNTAEARSHYLASLELLRPLDQPLGLATLLNNIAWAALGWGELDLSAAMLDEGLPLLRKLGVPVRLGVMLHTAGVLALERGQLDEAEALFAESLQENPLSPHQVPYSLDGLAIVAISRGHAERGLRLAESAAAIHREAHITREPDWRHRVDQAVSAATRQLSARQVRVAVEAGRQVSLAEAADHAVRGIRTGARPADAGHLSGRENEIARLVADGLTNGQIARRLNVSPRTVVTHLERIRGKLDLRSRAQLAAWIARTT